MISDALQHPQLASVLCTHHSTTQHRTAHGTSSAAVLGACENMLTRDQMANNCMQALRSLAIGSLSSQNWQHSLLAHSSKPLPASLSRLTALSSLALLDIGWKYATAGMPHLPRVGAASAEFKALACTGIKWVMKHWRNAGRWSAAASHSLAGSILVEDAA